MTPLPPGGDLGISWTYPQPLLSVTLRAIPLDDELAQVQQEYVSSVEAFPAHLHLQQDGIGKSGCQAAECLYPHSSAAPLTQEYRPLAYIPPPYPERDFLGSSYS